MIQDTLLLCFVYIPSAVILFISLFLVERYFKYKKLCEKYAHIPGYTQFLPPQISSRLPKWMVPEGIITNPYETFSPDFIVNTLKATKSEHYKIIFGIINLPLIVLDSPEFSKEIATKGAKFFRKTEFSSQVFLELFLGTNVFSEPDHQIWLQHRQLIDQSFVPSNLKLVAKVTNEVIEKDMIPCIDSKLEKRDVMVDFANLTMDVIGQAAFGYALDSFHSKPGQETLDRKTTIFLEKADLLRIIPSKYLRTNMKFGPIGELHRVIDSFGDIIRKIIEKREKNKLDEESSDDALSLLLKERKTNRENSNGGILTDEELISTSFVLLVAGHETTGRSLALSTHFLSENPHVQQELHDAIDKVVEENGRENFTFEDYESGKLDYVKAVFNETLRLAPVAFGIFRELPKTVECNGVSLPKDSMIAASFVNTLKSEKYWEDPLEFKPMRFMKDGKFTNPQNNPFVFTIFGIGGRICAGRYFALIEGICALAKLSRRYSFKHSDPNYVMKLEMAVTLRPTEKLLIDFIPRNK